MRDTNKNIISEHKKCSNLLNKLKSLESFLDDFNSLICGRDNIVCKNYAFSLQIIIDIGNIFKNYISHIIILLF